MKRKFVIIVAVFLLFTPLAFAFGYQTASFLYERKSAPVNYQSTQKYSSGKASYMQTSEQSPPSKDESTVQAVSSNEQPAKIEVLANRKVVYLTFDDGPDPKVTPQILDILKEYNIKATFFVIGNQIKNREEVLKRINTEGHSIGLHSWTHKYKFIYENNENFISEMNSTFNEVKKVTGIETRIIRFPGGSSKRLNASFLDKLHSENYYIYDWNATTGDGIASKNSPEQLYKNLLSYTPKASFRIVLMHNRANDINTPKALPRIIEHYQSLGYEFDVITQNTQEYYFKIQNK